MKRILLIAVLAAITFSSCKKDEEPNQTPIETVFDYYPLGVGNYWVYERSSCDTTWTDCISLSTDTCIVTKDTMINDLKYFKIEGVNIIGKMDSWLLRDSLDYIVDNHGRIHISNTDFESSFDEEYVIINDNDTIFFWHRKIMDHPNSVTVPSGTYDCLDNRLSLFRKADNFEREFNTHYYFAEDVGPVYESVMYASNTGGFKRELIGYKVIIEDIILP